MVSYTVESQSTVSSTRVDIFVFFTIFALGEEVFRSASTRMSNAIGYWDKDSGSRLYAIGTRQTDLCA